MGAGARAAGHLHMGADDHLVARGQVSQVLRCEGHNDWPGLAGYLRTVGSHDSGLLSLVRAHGRGHGELTVDGDQAHGVHQQYCHQLLHVCVITCHMSAQCSPDN